MQTSCRRSACCSLFVASLVLSLAPATTAPAAPPPTVVGQLPVVLGHKMDQRGRDMAADGPVARNLPIGQRIYRTVVELETDKVNVTVQAGVAGVLQNILRQTGEVVGINDVLATVTEGAGTVSAPVATNGTAPSVAAAPVTAAAPTAEEAEGDANAPATPTAAPLVGNGSWPSRNCETTSRSGARSRKRPTTTSR